VLNSADALIQKHQGVSAMQPVYCTSLGIFLKNPFCQPFVNFTFSRVPLRSGQSEA
jgi:hypothetical protein